MIWADRSWSRTAVLTDALSCSKLAPPNQGSLPLARFNLGVGLLWVKIITGLGSGAKG